MRRNVIYVLICLLVMTGSCKSNAEQLTIVGGGQVYTIVIPAHPSALEQRAATVLQTTIQRISGKQLTIQKEDAGAVQAAIYIGDTKRAAGVFLSLPAAEGYKMQAAKKDLIIYGGSGKGLIYGVYSLLEHYMNCSQIAEDELMVSQASSISLPADLHEDHAPQFIYRESYYPASRNAAYLEWNKLQQFEDLWGLWGHSYNKLVPAKTYFKAHPEYYALVKGQRQPTQLCLSNDAVYNIVVGELKKRIAANPDAGYWSISPNDDIGYCECDKCKPVDDAAGSPAGSLIKFVNHVATTFPQCAFTTLAYGYTHRAPKGVKPARNVFIMLSDIDAYRDKPLAEEGTAAAFRNDLKDWGALTPNIFIWDYITQFTNYLAPFPNLHTLQPNMQYLKEHGVKGVFAQGSGDTYGEWAELRSYLTAKLLENDKADVKKVTTTFLNAYYGKAAPYLQQYIDQVHSKMQASKRKLDIYGNPVNEWNSYLSPEALDEYSTLFDKAEAATEGNEKLSERVMRARLPLEYTVLQQARFYGVEKYGIFVQSDAGTWSVKPKFAEKISRFVANCKKAKVTEISEGGPNPDGYQAEWNAILAAGVTRTIATGATVTLKYPFVTDYPAKGNKTLVDGNPGYTDFSYNWLCFYNTPMEAVVDLGKLKDVANIRMHFLDDPRHWIFLPASITVEVSDDGVKYRSMAAIKSQNTEEHYEVSVKEFNAACKGQARFIKVSAQNLAALPAWRYKENKHPMIACDEIYVQ